MSDFQLSISGKEADVTAAADELSAILTEGEQDLAVSRVQSTSPSTEGRKIIDPLSLIAVILAVPVAIVATADIVERMRTRRKAEALINTARRLQGEKQVQIMVVAVEGFPRALDQLKPDDLLEIADKLKQGAPFKG